MERLAQSTPREAVVRGEGGTRLVIYTVLSVMLAAGAWVRFAPSAPPPVTDPQMKGLVELALVPVAASAAAIGTMHLPAGEADALAAAVQRGRLRLAKLALVDAATEGGALDTGHDVQVSASGYSTMVRLTHAPTVVTLPVGPVSTISFRTPDTDAVSIGAMGLAGPLRLPPLRAGQQIDAGVVAQ